MDGAELFEIGISEINPTLEVVVLEFLAQIDTLEVCTHEFLSTVACSSGECIDEESKEGLDYVLFIKADIARQGMLRGFERNLVGEFDLCGQRNIRIVPIRSSNEELALLVLGTAPDVVVLPASRIGSVDFKEDKRKLNAQLAFDRFEEGGFVV